MARTTPIRPGERAPDFVLPHGRDGEHVRLYGTAGGSPTVLVFSGRGGGPGSRMQLDGLRDALPLVDVHLVTAGSDAVADAFGDVDGRVHETYGLGDEAAAVAIVLGPNLRVRTVLPPADVAGIAAAVTAAGHEDDDVTIRRQAPVLLVPDAVDEEMRRRLVARWEEADTVETGVEATADGDRRERTDVRRKRRRDHTIRDRDLLRDLTDHVGRRVVPEVHKAFAYRATRFEGFKIGGYEASRSGFFEAHRDNLSATTAHRRFALSLNLNDDYEGGELRFPEYGRARYRPAGREALVFSGAHLHEVLPVTRGLRLVLLSFLFGDDARR